MSIVIQNVTPKHLYGKGEQKYQLRINQKVIADFTHRYEDGLASCLEAAAIAARGPNRREVRDESEFLMATFHAIEKSKGAT